MPGTRRRLLRLGAALAAAALAAAACAPAEEPPNLPIQQQGRFQVQVVDQLYDAGRGASVALQPDGTPVVSYLLYKPVLKKGDIPPPVLPGQPQPPAVILGTLTKGIWNRVSVTPQSNNPALGDAPELANKQGQAVQGAETDLALDAQGKHHMVWSTPNGGLFYADDAAGSFGETEKITGSPSFGASIAVGSDGTAWVSFYAGGSMRVARRTGPGTWKTDVVAKNAGPASAPATVSAIRVGPGGDPVVVFGDHGRTVVGRRSGGAWAAEQIPGGGGYGVSLALDKNGNPRVASYDIDGNVHEAESTGGSAWKVTDLGSTAPGPKGSSDARWSTGIAIDDKGTTFLSWADTKAKQIVLADDQSGNFSARPVIGSVNGTNPSLAVSADGKALALAWFDSVNANLEVAQSPSGGLTLAHPLPTNAPPTATAAPTGGQPQCKPSGTTIQVIAQGIAFDKACLAAPAGKAFTIDFDNKDAGTPHNVEIFTDPSATTRLGGAKDASDTIIGPATVAYKVDALKAGTYFFRCDIHPTQMTGTFVVA